MNQNRFTHLREKLRPQKLLLACCLLGFALFFGFFIKRDLPRIFEKDLRLHDESVNSVVAANVSRNFFPPMVRVNPLIKTEGIWMEGPYWQHIPPLFVYVPLPFFKLDRHVTIETKRLSYALIILLTGLLFILSVALFEKKTVAILAATLAACIWDYTPFTRRLITGWSFGTSDIVLGFTIICSFVAVCWYLANSKHDRKNYSWWKLLIVSMIVALPIVAKNVLGAIPAATFFLVALYDQKRINIKLLLAVFSFLATLALFFLPLYLSSPATFKQEILISFSHTQNYEGWARPWNIFFTDYLPNYYLKSFIWFFGVGLLASVYLFIKKFVERKEKILLLLSGGWFLWNLLVASIITSKAPNFIFQAYLLAVFFSVYALALILKKAFLHLTVIKDTLHLIFQKYLSLVSKTLAVFLILLSVASVTYYSRLFLTVKKLRAAPYNYKSEHEQFYHFGEIAQKQGVDKKDIFVFNSTADDCWFRYYTLFLTGAESRTFDELLDYNTPVETLKAQYDAMYLVVKTSENLPDIGIPHSIEKINDFKVIVFNTSSLNENYLLTLKTWLTSSLRLKLFSANSSCSWLLPKQE